MNRFCVLFVILASLPLGIAPALGQAPSDVTVRSLNRIRYADQYNWKQSPRGASLIAGVQATVPLSPCPLGIDGTDTWTYVHLGADGANSASDSTAEDLQIQGGTCTSGAPSGTLLLTPAKTHAPGFAISSSTAGWQEASNDARYAPTDPTGVLQTGVVTAAPGEYTWTARMSIRASLQVLNFEGVVINCAMADTCLFLGDNQSTHHFNIEVRNFRGRPMIPGGTFSMIEDNANGSRIERATTRHAKAGNTFGHLVQIDDDQAAVIDGLYTNAGTWGRCDATFCSSAIYGPGPFKSAAGVLWVLNSDLSLQCLANGIDDYDGNTQHVENTVIQAFPQFGVRTGTPRGGYGNTLGTNVYMEAGGCKNPIYNNAYAASGWIVEGRGLSLHGGLPAGATLPSFKVNAPGPTEFEYFVVLHNSVLNKNSAPLYIGKATVDPAKVNNIAVVWPGSGFYANVDHFDLLRASGTNAWGSSVPYSTGNFAVATNIPAATACTPNLCSFTDTNAPLASYSVGTGYFPRISYWPGAIFLGSNQDTTNIASGPGSYSGNSMQGINTVTPGGFNNIAFEGVDGTGGSLNGGAITRVNSNVTGADPAALLLPATNLGSNTKGIKGRLNFGSSQPFRGPTDFITLVDSNTPKTNATFNNRPANDAADAAVCLDQFRGFDNSGICMRAPSSVSNYINSVPDNVNWKERLTATQKSFAVPVVIAPGSTLTVGAGSPISQMKVFSTGNISPASVSGGNCTDQSFTVPGLSAADVIGNITPPGPLGRVSLNAYPAGAGSVTFHFCNPSNGSASPPSGSYSFLAVH